MGAGVLVLNIDFNYNFLQNNKETNKTQTIYWEKKFLDIISYI